MGCRLPCRAPRCAAGTRSRRTRVRQPCSALRRLRTTPWAATSTAVGCRSVHLPLASPASPASASLPSYRHAPAQLSLPGSAAPWAGKTTAAAAAAVGFRLPCRSVHPPLASPAPTSPAPPSQLRSYSSPLPPWLPPPTSLCSPHRTGSINVSLRGVVCQRESPRGPPSRSPCLVFRQHQAQQTSR